MAASPWWTTMPYRPRVQFRGQLPPLKDIYTLLEPDELRLLQIEGFDDYGILRCSLRQYHFVKPETEYTAISYTWNEGEGIWYGDHDTSPKPVRINGAAVLVSDKVANILCLARQHGRTTVWIDSICINQTDLPEKSRQVARMGDVYGRAAEVLAFLGSPSGDTDKFLDMVNSGIPVDKSSLPALVKHGARLWMNGYWRRAWIFQELALARSLTLVCGSRISLLNHIQNVLSATEGAWNSAFDGSGDEAMLAKIRHVKDMATILYSTKNMFKSVWKRGIVEGSDPSKYLTKGVHSGFLEVLRISRRHREYFDPRDMLYSRMAVASDSAALIPSADYETPVDEVYSSFAANHITSTRSLAIVAFARRTTMNLPTWAPDWTSAIVDWDLDEFPADSIDPLLELAWEDTALPRVSRCRTEVMVQGRILKTVSKFDTVQWEQVLFSALARLPPYRRSRTFGQYKLSEIPRKGDLICVLRGCPLLVFLRPVMQHFVVVGRHWLAREAMVHEKWGVITQKEVEIEGEKRKTWELKMASIPEVQDRKEEVFRIR